MTLERELIDRIGATHLDALDPSRIRKPSKRTLVPSRATAVMRERERIDRVAAPLEAHDPSRIRKPGKRTLVPPRATTVTRERERIDSVGATRVEALELDGIPSPGKIGLAHRGPRP